MTSVVVFGKSRLACAIAEYFLRSEEFSLLGVVPSTDKNPVFVSLADFAQEFSVPILELGDLPDVGEVDLGFSCYFSEIFQPHEIELFGRLVNLHNSPLPRYRGVRPINWALKNGEAVHGVTIHDIDSRVDTGYIVAQALFPIFPGDEVLDVYRRCQLFGWHLFRETAPRIMTLPGIPQDESLASEYRFSQDVHLGDRASFVRATDTPELHIEPL